MEKQISFSEKIRQIRKAKNLTMEAFGELVGVSKGTISKWESGEVIPPKTTLSLLEKLFGEGTQSREERKEVMEAREEFTPYKTEQFKEIKVYALAGAGHPTELVEPEPIDVIVIPKEFYRPSIVPVKVRGHSMEPNIFDGGYVGVDKEDRHVVSGEIYAVWIPYEGATIKRLYIDNEKVTLKSDNPLFPAFSILLKDLSPDNFILGKVKWVIQKL